MLPQIYYAHLRIIVYPWCYLVDEHIPELKILAYIHQIISSNFQDQCGIQEKWSSFKEGIREWKWAIIQPQFQSSSELGLRTENFDDTVSRRFYASSWSRSSDGLKFCR